MLSKAEAAIVVGDAQDVERHAKAVSALVRAERDVAEFAAAIDAHSPEEDEEARRAELRRRLVMFVEADFANAPPEVLERIALNGSAS
jgi:hypothetical protein